jgi:hypothetical protein
VFHQPNIPRHGGAPWSMMLAAAMMVAVLLVLSPAAVVQASDITGYRSAAFGMTEAETRAAIAADFGIAANDIPRATHDLQKTTILTIAVNGLVPGSGQAEISYVLGYRDHTLFQVTVLWRARDDSAAAMGRLLLAAQSMINRFALLGFPDGHVAPGSVMGDGVKMLFRSRDSHGKLALIGLYSPSANDGSGSAEISGKERPWLRVSFVRDAGAPDIFEIEPGQF